MIIANAEVLNSKRIKEIARMLQEQWGYTDAIESGFLQKDNDVFLITKDIGAIDLRKLNINTLGLYFAELRHNALRLSIEGSQIIGPKAAKNVAELNDEQIKQWLKGEDIELIAAAAADKIINAAKKENNGIKDDGKLKDSSSEINNDGSNSSHENKNFAIIKHNNDFFGCGRIKEGKLLNFVPKARRLSNG
ncbi:hypothetical protein HYX10_02840 [Candidatus Woesearchaeota archaeon]|nr:hypothetical protein [Candidatus Woesearchaeota archaeon]